MGSCKITTATIRKKYYFQPILFIIMDPLTLTKNIAKKTLGKLKCLLYNINTKGNIYIGSGTKFKGGKQIYLDKNISIHPRTFIWCSKHGTIKIGNGSDIGERTRISINNTLTIGEKVLISPNVYITDCDHSYSNINIAIMDQGITTSNNNIFIDNHTFIGINSVIIGDIKIGKGVVVGANSVVTKSIPDYCVAVGNPIKIIKKYDVKQKKWSRVQ